MRIEAASFKHWWIPTQLVESLTRPTGVQLQAMRVLRGCKMISFDDTYGGKSRILLGLLFLVSCVPPVRAKDYFSLNATSSKLMVGDRLISTPNHYFEFGIFPDNFSGVTTPSYYLAIRYAPPIDQVVTWRSNRSTPLSSAAVLAFDPNGFLELSDSNQNIHPVNIWNTFMKNVSSAQLLDMGNLVLMKEDGTEVWNSFHDSPPTDTLLPGQAMNRSQGHELVSVKRTGDPGILDANDTYSFGWDARGILSLSWTSPKVFLNWKGGSYIPAPDVYAAHTIKGVDSVYFHQTLGHLYIGSNPPTAILSGGPDTVNATTLKRITMDSDGGLRIWQYTINQTVVTANQTSNQGWKVVANWVVSDRPDSRSQCTTFGTCGPYSECVNQFDSLEPVTCRCPGTDFTPIDVNDPAKGCQPPSQQADCPNENGNYTGTPNPVGMLELPGVDMPWGGDYRNLTGNASVNCKQACMDDCRCAGAVYSAAEQMCWMKNGILLNLGYPTVALHGTDRTSYLRNQTVSELPQPRAEKKDNKLVKILVLAVGIPGALLIVLALVFCLWRNRMIPDCGSCCPRRPVYEIKFPEDREMQVRNEPENGAQIDGGRARTRVV